VATGHQAGISALVATPDGRYVATLADDRIARVFRADSLQEIARLHRSGAVPLALTIDDKASRLAVSYGKEVVVYDIATLAELGRIPDTAATACLAFAGEDLLVWRDGLVRWRAGGPTVELAGGGTKCTRMGLVGPTALVVHDGEVLHHGKLSADGWAAKRGPEASAMSLSFAPGMVAWSGPRGVFVWRTTERSPRPLPHGSNYGGVVLVDAGRAAVLPVPGKGTVRVELATRKSRTYREYNMLTPLGVGRIAYASLGRASSRDLLCTADSQTGGSEVCVQPWGGPVRSLAVAGGRLFVGADDSPLHAWSLGSRLELRRYSSDGYSPREGMSVLSLDGKRVARLEIGKLVVRTVDSDRKTEFRNEGAGVFEGVAWTPDGSWVTTIRDRSVVRVRADGGQASVLADVLPVRRSPQRSSDAFIGVWGGGSLVHRTDGKVLAVGIDDKVVLIRDDRASAVLTGPTQTEAVTALAFRPGTAELAVGFVDGHVRSWDTDAPGAPSSDRGLGAPVAALAFAADGSLIVTSDDAKVRVYRTSEAEPARVIDTRSTTALAVTMLDADRLVTGHVDGVVRIWRLSTASLLAALHALPGSQQGLPDWLVVGADGRFMASRDGDGSLYYGVRASEVVPFDAKFLAEHRGPAIGGRLPWDPSRRLAPGRIGPTVVAQQWTADVFNHLEFSADGQEIVGAANDGRFTFDVDAGVLRARAVDEVPTFQGADARAFVIGRPRRGEIVRLTEDGHLQVFAESPRRNLRTQFIGALGLGAQPDGSMRFAPTMALSVDGKVIAVAKASDKVRLFDTATLKPRGVVSCGRLQGFSKVAVSAGGAWVACVGDRVRVVRGDGKAKSAEARAFGAEGGTSAVFHPWKPLLAIATFSGGFLVDLGGGTEIRLEGAQDIRTAAAWSPDGTTLAMAARHGAIHLFDDSGSPLHTLDDRVARIDWIARVRPGVLAFAVGRRLRTWDAATGHGRTLGGHVWDHGVSWTPTGNASASRDDPGVVVTDASGARRTISVPDVRDVEIGADARRVFVAAGKGGKIELSGHDGLSGAKLWSQWADGRFLGLMRARSGHVGLVHERPNDGDRDTVAYFDAQGRSVGTYTQDYITDVQSIDGKRWFVGNPLSLTRLDAGAAETKNIAAERLAVSPDGLRIAATGGRELSVLDAQSFDEVGMAAVVDVRMRESVWLADDRIATLGDDGTIVLWAVRGERIERVGRLIAAESGGTVLVAEDGHYMAEAEAASVLGFQVGSRVFRFEQFDAALNRPHLALGMAGLADKETLKLYAAAHTRRARRESRGADAADAALAVPSVEFAERLPRNTTAASISLSLRVDAGQDRLARVNVRVNGVPLLGRRGLDVSAERATSHSRTQDVPLEVGQNRIEVEAETSVGVRGIGRAAIVTRVGKQPPGALHIIAIGVSDYREENDLRYAAKDSVDVADALARVAAPGAPVTRTVLRDGQVDRAAVLALRGQLVRTAVEDTVVMFVAGHGMLDGDGQYVFGTHDVDFATGARGVSFDELEGLLVDIPARRRLLLLDTCHAGELDVEELAHIERSPRAGARVVGRVVLTPKRGGPVDPRARAVAARALFTDLSRGSGVTVVAASAGAEYSYEDGAIGNGVFSRALIDGLVGGQADRDANGTTRVSELVAYLSEIVSRQSDGFQVPQVRAVNRDLDFDLTPGRRAP